MWLVLKDFWALLMCLILHWLLYKVASLFHHQSECTFWMVTFLLLLNGDWLHISGKCHVIDGDRRLGRKESDEPLYHGEEPGDSNKGLCWCMIVTALTVLLKNTEEVEGPLAWFMPGALPLNIPCLYFESGPWAKQLLDCSTLWPSQPTLPITPKLA